MPAYPSVPMVFIYNEVLDRTIEVPEDQLLAYIDSGWEETDGPADPNYPVAGLVYTTNGLGGVDLVDPGDLSGDGGAAPLRVVSVSYAATVTPNCDTTDVLVIGTLTGALNLATPTGTPTDGQQMRIRLVQDGTGRTVTTSSGYATPTGDSIPSTANASIVLGVEYNAGTGKWMVEAIKTVS